MATTLGQHLVDSALPYKWRGQGVLTKGNLHRILLGVAKENPGVYPNVVTKLKRLGDTMATLDGISVGLDDIEPSTDRDAALAPHLDAFHKATTYSEKEKALIAGQNAMLTLAQKHPGTMGEMVRSGGRGNAGQLMRTVGAPVLARDSRGKVFPWFINRSFAEGLKPADAWVAGSEARVNAVVSQISVTEPGDLAKILINNMGNQLVTMPDCGTKNGIAMLGTDPHIVDRYLTDGRLVTPQLASSLSKENKTVIVRSPMTCQAPHGVCQKCQGLSPSGGLHTIGTNVGVRAAQALAEPLTQFALNAKHGGRVASADDEKRLEGIKGVRALLEIPTSFAHKAVLASQDGVITNIHAAPQGGHYVFVNDINHYVPPGHKVTVVKGQSMYAGDMVSDGVPRPDEVVHYKGLGEGRKYLVDALSDVYKRAGSEIDKRHLETLAKSTLNYVKIVNPGPDDAFLKGDIVDYNRFHAALQASQQHVPLENALGEQLAGEVLHHMAGTTITRPIADQLTRHGITSVSIATQGPHAVPVVRPASRTPLLNPDWLARLAHRYLKESLLTGIHRGDVSNLHGASPIPAYAAGTEFGLGNQETY